MTHVARRGPRPSIEQRDLAEVRAGGQGADRPIALVDADGAVDDHVERVARLALEHEHVAGLGRHLAGEDRDRLDAGLIEIREQRHLSERGDLLVHRAEDSEEFPFGGVPSLRRMPRLLRPVRSLLAALREALANDGIRRLAISWALGIAADTACSWSCSSWSTCATAWSPQACSARFA